VLTADLDELFVYPGAERFGPPTLCRYLDKHGYEGVYAPMIDMYSDLPLSQTALRGRVTSRVTMSSQVEKNLKWRPAIAERLGCPPNVPGRGFRIPLPLGYFRDTGQDDVTITVRAAGTNIALQQTPINLPCTTRTAKFKVGKGWFPIASNEPELSAM
jgi:hypothetical protein